jgi:hypothetical protein
MWRGSALNVVEAAREHGENHAALSRIFIFLPFSRAPTINTGKL